MTKRRAPTTGRVKPPAGGEGVRCTAKWNADGSLRAAYYYWRATGEPIRGMPGSPEFAASLNAIRNAHKRLPAEVLTDTGGGWTQIIMAYKKSHEWNRLAPETREVREGVFRRILDRWDNPSGNRMSLLDIEDYRIRGALLEWRDEIAKAGTPAMADKVMAVCRHLITFAYDRSMIRQFHATKLRQVSEPAPRADIVHSPAILALVLEKGRVDLALAYQLARYSCAREADLCRLTWDMIDADGWLTFKPAKTARKTGVVVHLPTFALPQFRDLLAALPRKQGHRHLLIRDTWGGRPWTPNTLAREWRAFRVTHLDSADLHWHDIRGTTLTELAEAGCTDAERGAISGHRIGQGTELGTYTARTRRLALNAYEKWASYLGVERGKVVEFRR